MEIDIKQEDGIFNIRVFTINGEIEIQQQKKKTGNKTFVTIKSCPAQDMKLKTNEIDYKFFVIEKEEG